LVQRRAVAALVFSVAMLGTNIPTPLYGLYHEQFGLSPLMVTVTFAVFAAGVAASLTAFGHLSDEVGRRPVLIGGVVVSGLAATAFLLADGQALLILGRLLSGLSAGLFVGAGTATVVDLSPPEHRAQAATIAVVANFGGLTAGAIGSGLVAQYLGDPLRLPYWIDLALVALALLGLCVVPETVTRRRRARVRMRPTVPSEVRGIFVRLSLAGGSGFAATGLLAATASLFISQELHHDNLALFGLPAGLTFASVAVGQVLVRRLPERLAIPGGSVGMLVAIALIALSLASRTLAPLLVGSAVLGFAAGLSIGAGLPAITRLSPEARRAETASTFFLVLYLMLALPVVGVGALTQVVGLRSAGLAFSAAIATLLAACLVEQLRHQGE
jgi:MFS family permease